ncbi:MAG: DNA-binding response regulator [Bacteroidetes bacterium]|jgi:DNA-binding NarL/FixJ family response regulator|nr:DNA-binding response regulator [Bacteroidota bacterium]
MEHPVKIMIADDHQMFIDGIKALLKEEQGICITAQALSGQEVIEKLKTETPDIILMDIGMDVQNGIETTEIITKTYPKIRVIALTMYDDYNRITKMLKAGVKGYVLKNTSKEELISAINAVRSGESYFSKQVANSIIKENTQKTPDPVSLLTKRELQIIKLIAKSMTSKEIADELSLSELTVGTHRKNAMQKLEIKSIAGLVKFVIETQLA